MNDDESVLTRAAAAPDRVVAYGAHPDQQADVRLGGGSEPGPLLVIVHGGFWRPQYGRAQTAPMAAALRVAGWTVAAIGYRREPGRPDLSLDDVCLALEQLPSRIPGHDGRVVVVGHSAGGQLALMAAVRAPASVSAVLALAPAADLAMADALALGDGAVAAYLGGAARTRTDLDPRQAPALQMPARILHGAADSVVPLAVSESFLRQHAEVGIECLADAGHFALIDPLSTAWPHVLDAVTSLCRSPHTQRAA